MTTIQEMQQWIEAYAPPATAMSFDNVGLLVGDHTAPVQTVLLALDVTKAVIAEAEALGATLILTHHPVIFQPLKTLYTTSIPYLLAQKGIAVYSAHTNLDLAEGGVNDCLAQTLELQEIRPFALDNKTGLAEGRVGTLPHPMASRDFALHVKQKLGTATVTYTDGGNRVEQVVVGCGAGSYLIEEVMQAGIAGFVTGESKHHELLLAKEHGVTMVTAGHFATEHPVMGMLQKKLAKAFPQVQFHLSSQTAPACGI